MGHSTMYNKFNPKSWPAILLALMCSFSSTSYAVLPSNLNNQPLPSIAPMLEQAMPAVVNISTSKNMQTVDNPLLRDPFFRQFMAPNLPQQKRNSLGSGVIIDSSAGFVLTNNHVIDKADKIMVTLKDGRQLDAKLVGTDPESDVAVIQITAENLTALPIADSSQLRVGDFVVAIGNPFGLGQTVTSGIVSALGRSGLGIEGYEDFIQTDASINPGNSGGALVNLRGEFVGMNTAILAPTGGNVGIGFAIPSNMAITLKESLVKNGEVRRGLLGVTTQDLTPELVNAFDLENKQGAVISRIESNSPAARAGLEPGDIIVAINNKPAKNSYDIRNMIGLMQIGEQVNIDYYRNNKKLSTVATIGKPQRPTVDGGKLHPTLEGTSLGLPQKNQVEGVVIEKIENRSYAWRTGLRPGDIIVSANRFRIHNLDELAQVVNPTEGLVINIQRGEEGFFVVLR